jgi:hypothetical protein
MSSKETRGITKENGRRAADQLIVAALAGGCTYEEAARVAGVSKATVKRRMQQLEFRIQVGEARIATAERVRAVVLAAALTALGVVTELMQQAESEAVRLNAARTVLHHAEIGHQYIRVEDLERILGDFILVAENRMSPVDHEQLVRDCYALVVSKRS